MAQFSSQLRVQSLGSEISGANFAHIAGLAECLCHVSSIQAGSYVSRISAYVAARHYQGFLPWLRLVGVTGQRLSCRELPLSYGELQLSCH